MLAIEECLRKRTAFQPLEEALVIGANARAYHWLHCYARSPSLYSDSMRESHQLHM